MLRLRPLREEDYSSLYAVAADPLIWEQHPSYDRYQEKVFKQFFKESIASGGALITLDKKDGRIIGSSRFFGFDREKSEIEIGWSFLARSYWGGTFNREMKRLMLEHAFQFVSSVVFLIGPKNFRSQKAIEKLGGIRAGERVNASGVNSLVYEITPPIFNRVFVESRRK